MLVGKELVEISQVTKLDVPQPVKTQIKKASLWNATLYFHRHIYSFIGVQFYGF